MGAPRVRPYHTQGGRVAAAPLCFFFVPGKGGPLWSALFADMWPAPPCPHQGPGQRDETVYFCFRTICAQKRAKIERKEAKTGKNAVQKCHFLAKSVIPKIKSVSRKNPIERSIKPFSLYSMTLFIHFIKVFYVCTYTRAHICACVEYFMKNAQKCHAMTKKPH